MTITEPTCTTTPIPAHRSLPHLDAFEGRTAAAIALGRRLAAETDPDWQLYDISGALSVPDQLPGLRLWTGTQDAESVARWANRLGAPVTVSQSDNVPENIHHNVDSVIDGVPVHVWTIVREPITNTAVCENADFGWHVGYDQGGARKVAFFSDEFAARSWVARHHSEAAA